MGKKITKYNKKIKYLYLKKEHNIREIARALNVSCTLVRNRLNDMEIKIRRIHNLKREGATNWKGGITISKGYTYILMPEHILADASGYVKRTNLVWFKNTGEVIKKPYFLHHRNEDRSDDRFENLEKVTGSKHRKIHIKKISSKL